MLDWPDVIIVAAMLVLGAGAIAACVLGVWRLVLMLEWRYGDRAHWQWEILDFLKQRRRTGAYIDQIAYATALRPEHIERIITTELDSLVIRDVYGLCTITLKGASALAAVQEESI
jgi:hypothetical protein